MSYTKSPRPPNSPTTYSRKRASSVAQGLAAQTISVRERIELWKAREGKARDELMASKMRASTVDRISIHERFPSTERFSTSVRKSSNTSDSQVPAVMELTLLEDLKLIDNLPDTSSPGTARSGVADEVTKEFSSDGIKLSALSQFISNNEGIQGLTVEEVSNKIIMPLTFDKKVSYCSCIKSTEPSNIGVPTAYLVYTRSTPFIDVIESLQFHFKDNSDIFIWFDIFSLSLHDPVEVTKTWIQNNIKSTIQIINHTILMLSSWKEPPIFNRSWCLYELFYSSELQSKFDIVMPEQQLTDLKSTLKSDSQMINDILQKIDSEKSLASNNTEQDIIHEMIKENIGYLNLNSIIAEYLREWFIATAKSAIASESNETDKMSLKSTLGSFLEHQGRHDEAEPLYVEVMETTVTNLGPDSTKAISAMTDLAEFYSNTGITYNAYIYQ
jgi:hypothetical protein